MTRAMHWRGVCLALSAAVALATMRVVNAGEPEIPNGVGPLPDFAKGARGGALVSAQHIQSYCGVLPKEIADLVEQGEFSFEAVRSPREPLRFVRASVAAPQSVTLAAQGELQGLSVAGLPPVLFPLGEPIEGDTKQFAPKALWNAAAAAWRFKAFATQLSMYIFQKPDAAPHKLEFFVERVHPLSLGTAPGTLRPVFREKISARKPAAIKSLAWLTLRFFGPGEDFVWVASPVNRRIRQITGSNRSDPIFTGAFAPDDLFVWSGKPELVEPVSVSQVPLLVPLLEAKETAPAQQDGCFTRDLAGGAALNLNSQARRFQGAAGWVPANIVMALRNVLRIEITSRDPFSLDTRQVIYIDQSTGIPVYRMVWDQSGRLRKIALGVLRSLEGQPEESGPIIAGVILVHVNDGRRVALISDTFTHCDQYVPGRMLEDFDPSSFVRFEQPAAVQKKLEATPQPEDSQD